MKKKVLIFALVGMMGAATLFGGCGSVDREASLKYKQQGIEQLEAGDYTGAVESFQLALDQSQGKVTAEELDICYYKALSQLKAEDYQGAIETYTALVEYNGKDWKALYLRGDAYALSNDVESAKADYESAIALNGNDLALYAHIYEYLIGAGQKEVADTFLEKASAVKVNGPADYYQMGKIYYLAENYAQAESNLLQAKDGYDQAYLLLGRVYAAQGNGAKAKDALEAYMNCYPEDIDALIELGKVAILVEEYTSAQASFAQALKVADDEQKPEIWKNLIASYEYAGNFQNAYNQAKAYLAQYSDDAEMKRELEFIATRCPEKPDEEQQSTSEEADESQDDEDVDTSQDDEEDTSEEEN